MGKVMCVYMVHSRLLSSIEPVVCVYLLQQKLKMQHGGDVTPQQVCMWVQMLFDVTLHVRTVGFTDVSLSPFTLTFSYLFLCSPSLFLLPFSISFPNLVAGQQVQNRHVPGHDAQRLLSTWGALYICTFTRGDATVSLNATVL